MDAWDELLKELTAGAIVRSTAIQDIGHSNIQPINEEERALARRVRGDLHQHTDFSNVGCDLTNMMHTGNPSVEFILEGEKNMFNVGDRVRRKSGRTFSHGGYVATIERIEDDQDNRKLWLRETETYLRESYAELANDNELRVGVRVRVKNNCETMPPLIGHKGRIVDIGGGSPPIGIEFDELPQGVHLHECGGHAKDGHGYYLEGHEVAMINEEENNMSADQREWTPDDFLFTGQEVILNPDGSNYNSYNCTFKGRSGYVIDHQASDSDLMVILTSKTRHMPTWNITVQLEGGERMGMRVRDLLPTGEFKPVTQYRFSGGKRIYQVGDEKVNIDEMVIKEGQKIRTTTVYDQAFRNQKVAEAYEKISRQA